MAARQIVIRYAPVSQIVIDIVVEAEVSLIDQSQRRESGHQLRERGSLIERLRGCIAPGMRPQDCAALNERHANRWNVKGFERVLEVQPSGRASGAAISSPCSISE